MTAVAADPELIGEEPSAPTRCGPSGARLVLLGGVPGAGKTTAITRLSQRRPEVGTVDPETLRVRFERVLPSVPYRLYRPVVHSQNALRLLGVVLRGPTAARTALVVHDPATRPRRRWLTARLARARGWDPVLVLIDVSDREAVQGQQRRGRVVAPSVFASHWRRWQEQRPGLAAADRESADRGIWTAVEVVDRHTVDQALLALVGDPADRT